MTKAAEHKSVATTTAKSNKPFFNKGEGSALSLVSETEQPFFQKNNIPSIQAKLNIGQPNDKYEQEADAVADKTVQKLTESDTVQTKPLAAAIPVIHTKCTGYGQEEVQKKEENKKEEKLPELLRKPEFMDSENDVPILQTKAIFESSKENELQRKFAASSAPCILSKKEEINDKEEIRKKQQPGEEEEKIQTKLNIGQPGDQYEQEADMVADKVVQKLSESDVVQTKPVTPVLNITNFVQTQAKPKQQVVKEPVVDKEEERHEEIFPELQRKAITDALPEPPPDEKNNNHDAHRVMPVIQRTCVSCNHESAIPQKIKDKENLQRKEGNDLAATSSSSIEEQLASSKSGGTKLPEPVRQQMESSIGADFSNVKIHTDRAAEAMSEDLNAQAFTHGRDIYFNAGNYDTSSTEGRHLLAHELTHTVQQGVAVNKKENTNLDDTIQKAATPPKSALVSSEVVNISSGQFLPSEKVKTEIEEAGERGLDVRVIIPKIALEGKVKVKKNRKGSFDVVSGQNGFMPLIHAWANQVGGLYLLFQIKDNEIKNGFISTKQKGSNKAEWLKALKANSGLLGGAGLKIGKLPDPINEFSGTTYKLGVNNMNVEVGGFANAQFNFLLENGTSPKIDATADINVKGVVKGQLKLDNTKGKLMGEVSLGIDYKNFSGNVTVKYNEDGSLDIHGKAGYNSDKLSGEINFVSTDLESANNFAKDAIKAAGGKEKAQEITEMPQLPMPKEGKKERALAATGQLQFNLTTWFAGTVNVIVDGKGQVTVIGKIAPPAEIELFKQRDFDKELISLQIEAGYGIPVIGTIGVFAGVSLSAVAYIGPAKIYNIEIMGTYSTDPEVQKNIQISASVNISAYAGLRLRAEGGAKLTVLSHDLKIGVGVNADVGVKAYADARPTIGYRDPGEFYISGTVEMVAQPMLGLSGDFFIELDTPWWSPLSDDKWVWPIGSKEWPLTDPIGLNATLKDYVLGSGVAPEIEFKKPEFDPSKFMTKMVDKELPDKTSAGKPGQGTFKEDGTVTKPEIPDPKKKDTGKEDKGLKPGQKQTPKSTTGKKPIPDEKAKKEAGEIFRKAALKMKEIKQPITKADLKRQLDAIEHSVKGIHYDIKLEGAKWFVTPNASGVFSKSVEIAAIVTEEDKKEGDKKDKQGKKENIQSAITEIDVEGKKEMDEGEVTQKEAEAIKNKVNADHPSVIEITSIGDGGESWDFEYIQKKEKKSIPKKKRSVLSIETKITYGDGTAVAKPLTSRHSGTEKTIDIPGWDHAQKLNLAKSPDLLGRGGDWIKGHKITYRFGGKGELAKNLFIIDRSANGKMASAEGKADDELTALTGLTKTDDPDYNKVMYYQIDYTTHANSGLLSTFGHEINLTWGTINVNGSGKVQKGKMDTTSEKPPETAGEVRYKINNTGWETFYDVTKKKGIIPSFSQNLMRIRNAKGKYADIDDVELKLTTYHDTSISEETVEEQLKILARVLNEDLEFVVK
jgi:Domain of unknown function (DUF4157)